MELRVLTVPDCPYSPVLDERLELALADCSDVTVIRQVVVDEEQAARLGMRGSPTLLVDGVDPFPAPDVPLSVSCRIYRDHTGRLEAAPTPEQLLRVLREAGARPSGQVPSPPESAHAGAGVAHPPSRLARQLPDGTENVQALRSRLPAVGGAGPHQCRPSCYGQSVIT